MRLRSRLRDVPAARAHTEFEAVRGVQAAVGVLRLAVPCTPACVQGAHAGAQPQERSEHAGSSARSGVAMTTLTYSQVVGELCVALILGDTLEAGGVVATRDSGEDAYDTAVRFVEDARWESSHNLALGLMLQRSLMRATRLMRAA